MTEKEILDLILKVSSSLVPGLLAYTVLYKTNVIFPRKNRADENKILITALSLINVMFGMIYFSVFSFATIWIRAIVGFVALTLFSIFILPPFIGFVSKKLSTWINTYRREDGYGYKGPKTNFVEVFDHPNPMRVSVFDFSGNHVISGSTKHISDDNQFDYFDWVINSKVMNYGDDFTTNEAINMYKKAEEQNMGIYLVYVDFEKKLIFHTLREEMREEININ
ncbi:hypothetical protein [Enterococcus faecalis]|nr:hypothetical protein [Enterococcus faecalis]TQA64405.1 hypothetical protein FKY80_01610 [Enterococcus faecalis]